MGAPPPTCRSCGTALPRAALFCPKCSHPVFTFTGRRARRLKDASLIGLAGSLIMALQSACMLVGGVIALAALNLAVGGDLSGAERVVGTAAIFVGLTLLFDLVGISMLAIAFYFHSRAARASSAFGGAPDPERKSLAFQGFLAMVFLLLWILVTLAWRGALAALVSFYPTPLGIDLNGVGAADLRRAASIMLALWVAAAILLFVGTVFGTRFLQRARAAPLKVTYLFWPFETALHAGAALGIALLAQDLLSRPRFEVSTLGLVQTLGVLDLVIVPVLGLLAYVFLFREFFGMFREVRPAAPPAPTTSPADPPGEG